MNLTAIIKLKAKIAALDGFTPREREFLLDCIKAAVGAQMSKGVERAPDDADAYSIEEFCARHRISAGVFYKLRSLMPVTFNVGTRVLISREAAAIWRRTREASPAKPAPE